jgi:hypothetical protein
MVPVKELGILLLQESTVHQDQFSHIPRRFRRVDPAAETIPDKPGQVSAVVEMGMCQDDGVDGVRLNWKLLPVQFAQVLESLEQAAIDQDAMAFTGEQVL